MSNSKPRVAWIALVVLTTPLLTTGCSVKISDRVVNRITTTEASARHSREDPIFIDARPAPAFNRGHIAGAINIRLGDLSRIDRDQRIVGRTPKVVYGENPGSATAIALAKQLMEMDYEGVEFFEPGFSGWRSAGLPIERGETD